MNHMLSFSDIYSIMNMQWENVIMKSKKPKSKIRKIFRGIFISLMLIVLSGTIYLLSPAVYKRTESRRIINVLKSVADEMLGKTAEAAAFESDDIPEDFALLLSQYDSIESDYYQSYSDMVYSLFDGYFVIDVFKIYLRTLGDKSIGQNYLMNQVLTIFPEDPTIKFYLNLAPKDDEYFCDILEYDSLEPDRINYWERLQISSDGGYYNLISTCVTNSDETENGPSGYNYTYTYWSTKKNICFYASFTIAENDNPYDAPDSVKYFSIRAANYSTQETYTISRDINGVSEGFYTIMEQTLNFVQNRFGNAKADSESSIKSFEENSTTFTAAEKSYFLVNYLLLLANLGQL